MGELVNNGTEVIRCAEEELRRLLGRAAESGDYDSLLVLTDWAKQLGNLLDGSGALQVGQLGDSKVAPQNGVGVAAAPDSRRAGDLARTRRRRKRAGGKQKRSVSGPPEYPKFLRDGEHLVKIGWSKKDKATYEHRAPRRILAVLFQALRRAGGNGQRFTTDNLLPLKDREDGTEIPSYQVYLGLAWLRAEKLLVQYGRQGYSLPAATDLDRLAEARFEKLPRR